VEVLNVRALQLTLQTRFGRRIGGLFVISALVPIVVLAVLGYRQVRDQLMIDADAQLRQAAKSVGMELIDRLTRARDLAVKLAAEGTRRAAPGRAASLETQAREAFDAVARVGAVAAMDWGEAPTALRLGKREVAALDSGRTILVPGEGEGRTVWMVQPLTGSSGQLWVSLRADYLVAGARERSTIWTGDASLCVRWAYGGRPIYCDPAAPPGEAEESATWNAFLGYAFDAGAWSVEVRRPMSAVLAPIRAFRRTFFATLVAVLGLVVLLTTSQVRRGLQPLEALRAGTARLARRDFSGAVTVHSGDEFEDLAGSFNLMAGDLDQQFRSNAQLITRLSDLTYGALAALARAVDASSPWTAGHSERVTAFSMRMASRLPLSGDQMDALLRGGLLHDIGKIGISPLILDKPGSLTPEEQRRIREHPELGARILAPLAPFADAIPVVRHHHEWWNGAGYPDGLRGEEIPFLARLLTAADVYDALVSSRPYRVGWPQPQAIEEIERGAGTQFDPAMVELFMAVLAAEGDQARFAPTGEAVLR
jgi:putative nucleotidyltransferase with HDIG domain